jgi:hypothetical protein
MPFTTRCYIGNQSFGLGAPHCYVITPTLKVVQKVLKKKKRTSTQPNAGNRLE